MYVTFKLTGSKPTKNDHPGVHPENDGSKWVNANEAVCRPAAALTERHIIITRPLCIRERKSYGIGENSTDDTKSRPASTYDLGHFIRVIFLYFAL